MAGGWLLRPLKVINKFYITYLVLDASRNIKNKLFDFSPERYRDEQKRRFHTHEFEAIQNDFAKGDLSSDVDKTLHIYFGILSQLEIKCKSIMKRVNLRK